jgi:tRNA (guanosine-2'-O-)-methyltransferase
MGAKSSSSAAKWLTVINLKMRKNVFLNLERNTSKILTTHLSSDVANLYEIDLLNVALVFGNEHSGVSEEIRSLADGNFIIHRSGIIRSLNISVACAVTLYEAYRQKALAGHYDKAKLNGEVLKDLMDKWGYEEESDQ